MKPIDADTVRCLEAKVPNWITAVKQAKPDKLDTVILTLDAFAGEAELLYEALWYAHSEAVGVTLAPPDGTLG